MKLKEEAQVKHDKTPHHKLVVLFDIDKEVDKASSMSQVEAIHTKEAPIDSKCFSETPLLPRCLHFSESESSHNQQEEDHQQEAPNKLSQALARVFICMLGRKARLDLQ